MHFTPYLCLSCISHQCGESDKYAAAAVLQLIKGSEWRMGRRGPCSCRGAIITATVYSFNKVPLRYYKSFPRIVGRFFLYFMLPERMFILCNHGLQVLKFLGLVCKTGLYSPIPGWQVRDTKPFFFFLQSCRTSSSPQCVYFWLE